MTGLLKDLLHDRADHLDAPTLDVAEITRAGERHARRRRTAAIAGVAAASVVAALTGAAFLQDRGDTQQTDLIADGTSAIPLPLGWVTGRTLHVVGAEPVELSEVVRAWVWVGGDIVYTDKTRQVHLWQDGTDEVVGRTALIESDDAELVADGDRVAWVDDDRALASYDTTTGELSTTPRESGTITPRVTAIDGTTVYAVDAAGVLAWHLETGDVEVLDRAVSNVVLEAENGVLIRHTPSGQNAILTRDGTTFRLPVAMVAYLSPDARLVSTDGHDEGQIFDAVTGARKAFDHGYGWALGYQWLDDTRLAVLALDGTDGENLGDALLVTCDGPSGECDQPGQQLPGSIGAFQLPIGIHLEP